MDNLTYIVPCLFGLEGLAGDELRRLGMADVQVEDRRVTFRGDFTDLAKANLCLRTGERVMVVLSRFRATTFEELFQGVLHTPLSDFIGKDDRFPVKGHCLNSQLMSVPDCQAIIKKAASRQLGEKYGLSWLPETGVLYQLHFTVLNDEVTLCLDTSGQGLHKRGYRAVGNDAPLHETLAAGLVTLSRYRGKEVFLDPFCGSGTIPIEAALIAKNRAPGLSRSFAFQSFPWVPETALARAKEEARDKEFSGKYTIIGWDNDPACVSLSFANARKAGVSDCVRFADEDATKGRLPAQEGILVGNPPYGERMLERETAQRLYRALGAHLHGTPLWKKYILTAEPEFEHFFGARADKKRKFYNGKIRCDAYMYLGESQKKRGGKP